MSGPLKGLKVLETPAIGPVPFCGMLLADLGADVLRLDRTGDSDPSVKVDVKYDLMGRGKRSLAVDLKATDARELVLSLIEKADVLIEGFRPGTMERLGLGPEVALERNPRLVYGRMTGWGQEGPLAAAAGHDINYLALTGALHAIGRKGEAPVPPLNLGADFGGGSLYLALGILSALHERQQSGLGQVIDAAMVDGAASLMTMFYGLLAQGIWSDRRGENFLDSGAPWYNTYQCKDGRFIAIGALEAKFFGDMVQRLGFDPKRFPDHMDRTAWPQMAQAFAEVFRGKTRDEWCAVLEGSDACFAPVLGLREAPQHDHMKARRTFIEHAGVVQPGPAPRFSRTPGTLDRPPPKRGEGGAEARLEWGVKTSR